MRTAHLCLALLGLALALSACGDERSVIPPPNPAVAVPPPPDLAAPPQEYQPSSGVERRLPQDD